MKTTRINYTDLMGGRLQCGGPPFTFTAYYEQGSIRLLPSGRYVFLFILQGSLRHTSFSCPQPLDAGCVTVVDKKILKGGVCHQGTILLEYTPPERMSKILHSCAKAYHTDCFEIVKLDSMLDQWCRQLLSEYGIGIPHDRRFYNEHCRRLTSLMLRYPLSELGNLAVPLKACSMHPGACESCMLTDREMQTTMP